MLAYQGDTIGNTYRSSRASLERSSSLTPSIIVPIAMPSSVILPPAASTAWRRRATLGSAACPRSTMSKRGRGGSEAVRIGLWAVGLADYCRLLGWLTVTRPQGSGDTNAETRRVGSPSRWRRGPRPGVSVMLRVARICGSHHIVVRVNKGRLLLLGD